MPTPANNTDNPAWAKALPDIGDVIFIFLLVIMLGLRPSYVFGDGSTGWHIFTGQYILEHHLIPHADIISYTHPGQPWVAYEWLSDLLMACIYQLGGMKLLAVAVAAAIAFLFLLLYERCRRQEHCHFLTTLFLTVLGSLASSVHWLARPHIFTFFGVYLFSTKLEDRYKGTISGVRFYLPLALFMLIWVNSHPAFLIGFVLIAIYLFASLVGLAMFADSESRHQYLFRARDFSIVMLITAATTLANPYGVKLYEYIRHYLKGNAVLQATIEYQSPVFHGDFSPACLEILFAMFILALALSAKRLTLPRLLTCLLFAHLALTGIRHIPLFVIVLLPAIAELFSKVKPITSAAISDSADQPVPILNKVWRFIVAKLNEVGDGFNENEALCQMHVVPMAAVGLLSLAAIFWGGNYGLGQLTSDFDEADKPTKTLVYLIDKEQKGELKPESGFNYDNWGGYIRFKMHNLNLNHDPNLEKGVFIDDRADFYGEPFYLEYAAASQTQPNCHSVLDKYKINWILFPSNSRLAEKLRADPDWAVACQDPGSYLIVRKHPL